MCYLSFDTDEKSSSSAPSEETGNLPYQLDELAAGFSDIKNPYIDSHGRVEHIIDLLNDYMSTYLADPTDYIAPYTSLVASLMMGKTRLMKQMAHHMPCIYICFRSNASTGYPQASPMVPKWLLKGTRFLFQPPLSQKDIDKDIEFHVSGLKFSLFLIALLEKLAAMLRTTIGEKLTTPEDIHQGNYWWLWDFFAEPSNRSTLGNFWKAVVTSTESKFKHMDDDNNWC